MYKSLNYQQVSQDISDLTSINIGDFKKVVNNTNRKKYRIFNFYMDTILTTFVISTITGIVTFFLGARKQKKETDALELDNIKSSIGIYQTIIADLKEEIISMSKKIDKLESSVDELMKENTELKEMLQSKKRLTSTK